MIDENEIIRPTPERMAKAGDNAAFEIHEIKHGEPVRVLRMKDSPIDRLAFGAKPKITGEQYHAAVRFYTDAYGAGLMPLGAVDTSKDVVDGGQYKNISDAKIAAQVRYEHAIRRLSHQHFHILESIVIQEVKISEYATRFKRFTERRERIAITIDRLCCALDELAKGYNPPRRDRGIGASHAPDYRPNISPQKEPG